MVKFEVAHDPSAEPFFPRPTLGFVVTPSVCINYVITFAVANVRSSFVWPYAGMYCQKKLSAGFLCATKGNMVILVSPSSPVLPLLRQTLSLTAMLSRIYFASPFNMIWNILCP